MHEALTHAEQEEARRRAVIFRSWKADHPQPTSEDIVALLLELGRPPDIRDPELDPTKARCACNKLVDCGACQLVRTGHLTAIEPVCEPCRPDYAGLARLVCVRCRSVIGWFKPMVDKHGFRFEADRYYHVAECAVCKKGLQSANIIEMMVYYDAMGIPYPKDLIT